MVSSESRVLEVLASLGPSVTFTEQQRVALNGVDAESVARFARHTYRELKNHPLCASILSSLIERGLRSEFPLSEWFRQINGVYEWLEGEQRSAKLSDVVDYISCAFEGSSSEEPGTTVHHFLSRYGFARSFARPAVIPLVLRRRNG